MPPQLALLVCVIFILWLFARDRKLRPMTSWGLWVALLWIMIIGSRPVGFWFGGESYLQKSKDYILEGSALDRNVFLVLIVAGVVVLLRRRVNWRRFFASNRWYFAFFIYCGISVIWSDYPFVSFKRWSKGLGMVVMVLIILTENDPVQSMKAVFARYTYFAIPFSIVFIKYFPEFGRYYNRWTWEPGYCGVATYKNELGCILFCCGLFLFWDLIEMRTKGGRKTDKADLLCRIVLLSMVFWLTRKANCATALLCLILGMGILFFMRSPVAKRAVRYLGTLSLAAGLIILLLYSAPGLFEPVAEMLGREANLTGRTGIWTDLLKEPVNPFLGVGYEMFWVPATRERYRLTQAHNGYLETYLNGGLVGVFLLLALIVTTGSKLKRELLLGSSYGILRFSFLVTTVLYNWTEALFRGVTLIWMMLLIAALDYPHSAMSMPKTKARKPNGFR